MACATQLGAVSFCSASTLDPSYSYIELVEYHSEPQRMRRSPVTIGVVRALVIVILGLSLSQRAPGLPN
jgi:hypothetical protein